MTIGIYEIKNINNNKRYIGSSIQIDKRWRDHKRDLKNNKHHSVKLQAAWNKEQNKEVFVFKVIEILDSNINIFDREQYYIDYYNKFMELYNSNKDNIIISKLYLDRLKEKHYKATIYKKIILLIEEYELYFTKEYKIVLEKNKFYIQNRGVPTIAYEYKMSRNKLEINKVYYNLIQMNTDDYNYRNL